MRATVTKFANWEHDITAEIDESPTGIVRRPGEAISHVEGSPLLREVEEAHAQLQAAFQEPERKKVGSPAKALEDRVRRLEASLNALVQNRSLPSE